MRVRISDDSAALAVGADMVARAFEQAGIEVERVSSWGMHWLEPLVDVDGVGYPNVTDEDVQAILEGTAASIGPIEKHPFIVWQTRLIFLHSGRIRPLSLDDYDFVGGWAGLREAKRLGQTETIQLVTDSGLRGRGGAAHLVGAKWKAVAQASGDRRYLVCNANEGGSGSTAGRAVMEGDPFLVIEGMAIAAFAVGAQKGFIFIRAEYPHAIAKMLAAVEASRALVAPFEIEVRIGAGSYISGEETALLNAIEGKPAMVRDHDVSPTQRGLFGCPTLINNVVTFATLPWLMVNGATAFSNFGMGGSRGTIPFQLSGDIKHSGIFETAFGLSVGELVNEIGGGTRSGRPVRAVQLGGQLGAFHPIADFDLPLEYEAVQDVGGRLGNGSVVVFDSSVDMSHRARLTFRFCEDESCGKCSTCFAGPTRGIEMLDKMIAGKSVDLQLSQLARLSEAMREGSQCDLARSTATTVMSAIMRFPQDFSAHPETAPNSAHG